MRFRSSFHCVLIFGLVFGFKHFYLNLIFSSETISSGSKLKIMLMLATDSCWSCVKAFVMMLQMSKNDFVKVIILNNHSEKYKENLLKLWYPEAEVITGLSLGYATETRLQTVLENFTKTDNDWLIYMSTDILVTRNWISTFEKVASIYRSSIFYLCETSNLGESSEACDKNCLPKLTRLFGTAWPIKTAVDVLSKIKKQRKTPNWNWLTRCSNQGISMVCLRRPLINCTGLRQFSKYEVKTEAKNFNLQITDLQRNVNKTRHKLKVERKNFTPVYVNYTSSPRRFNQIPCDVPCFWEKGHSPNIMKSDKYKFRLSMEGYHYYPKLSNRKWSLGTTSFDSEIPLPYFNWTWTRFIDNAPNVSNIWSHSNIQTPPKGDIPRILFMARNCKSRNNREKIVKALFHMIDSVSSCLQNKNVGRVRNKEKFMEKYMFYAAFENGCVKDYITEKLWGAFVAGTLPIVYGPPNIWEHVPAKSILNVADFPSIAALREHVEYLIKNRTAYDEYHAWRKRPLPGWFVTKYNFTHVHSACRLCRWVAAKRDGLKWDRVQQDITYD